MSTDVKTFVQLTQYNMHSMRNEEMGELSFTLCMQ